MKMRPATVVAGWTTANVLLMVLLIGLGGTSWAIILYALAAIPMYLFAAIVWRSVKVHGDMPEVFRLTDRVGVDVLAGLAAVFVALAIIYYWWLGLFAAAFLIAAAILGFRPREHNPPGPDGEPRAVPLVAPDMDSIPSYPGRLASTFPRPSGSKQLRQAHAGDSRWSQLLGGAAAVVLAMAGGRRHDEEDSS
jgi:hypothetical protein